jgi:hypothetical protein
MATQLLMSEAVVKQQRKKEVVVENVAVDKKIVEKKLALNSSLEQYEATLMVV